MGGEQEVAMQVTQYVEEAPGKRYRFYVVMQTENRHFIVTEKNDTHGEVTWNESPCELDARNAFAKVCRSADCHGTGIIVSDAKKYFEMAFYHGDSSETYARSFFDHVVPGCVKTWDSLTAAERTASAHLGV